MPDDAPENPRTSAPENAGTEPAGAQWVALSGVGFEFVAAILLPGAAGWWLDKKLGSAPWLMLVGGLLGFATGFYLLMKAVRESSRK